MGFRFVTGLIILVLVGSFTWLGWHWYTTPVPPDVPPEGMEPSMVAAIDAARQEVRRQPRSGEAWGTLAMVLDANGITKQSLECYAWAERLDPEDPRWPYLHGVLLLKGNPRDGIRLLRQALAVTRMPDVRAVILFRLALQLIQNEQLDEAQADVQALAECDPLDGARARYCQAMLAIHRDDRAKAREFLQGLAGHPLFQKQANSLLASLSDGDGDLARAYKLQAGRLPDDQPWPDPFAALVELHKVDRMSRIAPFTELEKQGRHAEALVFLQKLAADAPDAEVCFLLGMNLIKAGRFEEAAAALRKSIGHDARNVKAHLFLGEALLRQGEQEAQKPNDKAAAQALFREAVAAEDQALAIHRDLAHAHLARGRALAHLGRTDEALTALRQALSCQLESAEMHLALGETLAEAGRVNDGLKHLENAARLARPGDSRPAEVLKKWQAKAAARP